ncbi:MAG: hypothetical protein ACXVCP_06765 [Bdellovibrio sp.]
MKTRSERIHNILFCLVTLASQTVAIHSAHAGSLSNACDKNSIYEPTCTVVGGALGTATGAAGTAVAPFALTFFKGAREEAKKNLASSSQGAGALAISTPLGTTIAMISPNLFRIAAKKSTATPEGLRAKEVVLAAAQVDAIQAIEELESTDLLMAGKSAAEFLLEGTLETQDPRQVGWFILSVAEAIK